MHDFSLSFLIKCKNNANGLNLNYFLTFLSRKNTIRYKFESINPDLVSVKFDAFITITNEREHDGQNLLAIDLETFCVSVECLEIAHKNALLTSGPVKKAHLKIHDGVFVPGVSF